MLTLTGGLCPGGEAQMRGSRQLWVEPRQGAGAHRCGRLPRAPGLGGVRMESHLLGHRVQDGPLRAQCPRGAGAQPRTACRKRPWLLVPKEQTGFSACPHPQPPAGLPEQRSHHLGFAHTHLCVFTPLQLGFHTLFSPSPHGALEGCVSLDFGFS